MSAAAETFRDPEAEEIMQMLPNLSFCPAIVLVLASLSASEVRDSLIRFVDGANDPAFALIFLCREISSRASERNIECPESGSEFMENWNFLEFPFPSEDQCTRFREELCSPNFVSLSSSIDKLLDGSEPCVWNGKKHIL